MKLNDVTIKVHKFGPLENVSFKLAPMMIFTGMSSLGKSYANYLVYYFMASVCNGMLREIIENEESIGEDVKQLDFDLDDFLEKLAVRVEPFMKKFLGDDDLKCDAEFRMLKKVRSISFEIKKASIGRVGKDDENRLMHTQQAYIVGVKGNSQRIVPSISYARFYLEQILQNFVLGENIGRAVILPPGRGAFAGENFSVKSEVASSMNMYNLFFRDYDVGINSRMHFREGGGQHLPDRLLNMTSGGELLSVEGKQYLQLNENERIALSAGASSVKDLSPWLFYLKNYWMIPCSFCMEEPEAHQHPSVTVQIADVMAMAMHQRMTNIFHLTTHSDYLIQRLNQLVRLGSIRRQNKHLFDIICEERKLDSQSYLDASDIKAYYFSKANNGKTIVERLNVTDDGIPMKSFFDVVRDLEEREEYINDAVYRMVKEQL